MSRKHLPHQELPDDNPDFVGLDAAEAASDTGVAGKTGRNIGTSRKKVLDQAQGVLSEPELIGAVPIDAPGDVPDTHLAQGSDKPTEVDPEEDVLMPWEMEDDLTAEINATEFEPGGEVESMEDNELRNPELLRLTPELQVEASEPERAASRGSIIRAVIAGELRHGGNSYRIKKAKQSMRFFPENNAILNGRPANDGWEIIGQVETTVDDVRDGETEHDFYLAWRWVDGKAETCIVEPKNMEEVVTKKK